MRTIYVVEVSNAPHETSIMSTIELFSKLDFRTSLCLNNISESRFKKLDHKQCCNIMNLSNLKGLIKFFRAFHKDDFVIYNTVSFRSIFIVFLISLFTSKNIYYVRNANSWIYRPKHAKKFFHIVIGNFIYFIKKYLLKNAYALACGSYTIKSYLDEKTMVSSFVIPFNYFSHDKLNKNGDDHKQFSFVIPGNINLLRKNLQIIRDASLLFDNAELKQFKIILLGRPVSKYDKEFIESWKDEIGETLVFYTSFIPAKEFDEVLKKANVVLGVVNVNYRDRFNNELYGQTKDTGIEAHAIAYAKPLIINADYLIEDRLLTSTLKFSGSKDCYNKMKEVLNNEVYQRLLNSSRMSSKFYSIENLSLELKSIIES